MRAAGSGNLASPITKTDGELRMPAYGLLRHKS